MEMQERFKREGFNLALDIKNRRETFPDESYEMTASVLNCTVDEVRAVAEYRPSALNV